MDFLALIAVSHLGVKTCYSSIKVLGIFYSYVEIVDKITDLNSYIKI
jgi:hypothetical protein